MTEVISYAEEIKRGKNTSTASNGNLSTVRMPENEWRSHIWVTKKSLIVNTVPDIHSRSD